MTIGFFVPAFHHLNDLPGQRADIGAAMPTNFSLVTNAAQR
jgi:hypothetical protein